MRRAAGDRVRRVRTPLLACGLAAAAGCDWDWPDGGGVVEIPPMPVPVLASRYALTGVNGAPLPYTISTGAARVRLLADTLVFQGAGTPPADSGTYVEIRVVGTQQGTGAEALSTTTSAPRAWRRGTTYAQLLLDDITGIGVTTVRSPTSAFLGNQSNPTQPVYVSGPGAGYTFEPR